MEQGQRRAPRQFNHFVKLSEDDHELIVVQHMKKRYKLEHEKMTAIQVYCMLGLEVDHGEAADTVSGT